VGEAIVRHGHAVQSSVASGDPLETLQTARKEQLDLLTNDAAMANTPFEKDFWFNRSLVFLQLEGGELEQDDAVDRLFERYKRLTPGRMYTVTGSRVKVRQLPSKK
jgi:hypothetical protein